MEQILRYLIWRWTSSRWISWCKVLVLTRKMVSILLETIQIAVTLVKFSLLRKTSIHSPRAVTGHQAAILIHSIRWRPREVRESKLKCAGHPRTIKSARSQLSRQTTKSINNQVRDKSKALMNSNNNNSWRHQQLRLSSPQSRRARASNSVQMTPCMALVYPPSNPPTKYRTNWFTKSRASTRQSRITSSKSRKRWAMKGQGVRRWSVIWRILWPATWLRTLWKVKERRSHPICRTHTSLTKAQAQPSSTKLCQVTAPSKSSRYRRVKSSRLGIIRPWQVLSTLILKNNILTRQAQGQAFRHKVPIKRKRPTIRRFSLYQLRRQRSYRSRCSSRPGRSRHHRLT